MGHTYRDIGPAYWRAWRAAHPEYRQRERDRSARRRRVARLERDRLWVEELIAELDRAEGAAA
jgi:hypothetical protein